MSLAFSLSDLTTPEGLERVLRQIENALNDIKAVAKSMPEPVSKPAITPTRVIPTGGVNIVQAGDRTTITSTGVTSIAGTINQINVSPSTGDIVLSTPQNTNTGAAVQFAREGLGAPADGTYLLNLNGTLVHGTGTGAGIDITDPQTKLEVASSNVSDANFGNLFVSTTDSEAVDRGGVLALGGRYTGTTRTPFAGIGGRKDDSTDGHYSGYMTLLVGVQGTGLKERARLLSDGSFGIGAIPTKLFSVAEKFQVDSNGLIPKYNNVNTAGEGVPAIYGQGRATGQTGANSSVAAFTPSADGSFIVSMNILVTAFTAGTISGVITYTDEGGTARSLTMNFSSIGGTLGTTVGAAGVFEGVPLHIRAKGGTAITMTTTVAVFTGTYNVEGIIQQLA